MAPADSPNRPSQSATIALAPWPKSESAGTISGQFATAMSKENRQPPIAIVKHANLAPRAPAPKTENVAATAAGSRKGTPRHGFSTANHAAARKPAVKKVRNPY